MVKIIFSPTVICLSLYFSLNLLKVLLPSNFIIVMYSRLNLGIQSHFCICSRLSIPLLSELRQICYSFSNFWCMNYILMIFSSFLVRSNHLRHCFLFCSSCQYMYKYFIIALLASNSASLFKICISYCRSGHTAFIPNLYFPCHPCTIDKCFIYYTVFALWSPYTIVLSRKYAIAVG